MINSEPFVNKQYFILWINCTLQGRYAGNAIGFKIGSLLKLMETRANKPRMTLLHYLVDEAEKEDKHVLEFADELQEPLTAASR